MNSANLIVLALSAVSLIGHGQQIMAQANPDQPAPVPVESSKAGAASDGYVIGASDVLVVTVWKEPTLSGTILVRPDGMISLALLGDVQASGLTPLQLADQISAKLKKYI